MTETSLIRNTDTVVAWDEDAAEHCYLRNADVAFSEGRFTFVGPSYQGPVDRTIDGRGLMVMPGLVNLHSHPHSEPAKRGISEELGSPQFGQSGLYEYLFLLKLDRASAVAAARVAWSEMLKSGVTTVVDLTFPYDGWVDELAASGMRGVICPMIRSGAWYTDDGRTVNYRWDEEAGRKDLDRSLSMIDNARAHPSGRMDGMPGPAQIETCTEELLRDALAAARERGIPMHLHAAQSKVEFDEITRRHAKTPIEYMESIGILGPDTVIAHCVFTNDHPWLHWPHAGDFELLRESGAALAHCPGNFVRRGIPVDILHRCAEAGITVGLGTDTFPHNMITEMVFAIVGARLTNGAIAAGRVKDAFDAATVGGARALRRDDIGRVAPGCKADFSLVDLAHPYMRPVREPLRSLVFSADDRAVRDVYVDGECVLKDGKVLTYDVEAALEQLSAAQAEAMATVAERDWAGRDIDTISPGVYRTRG